MEATKKSEAMENFLEGIIRRHKNRVRAIQEEICYFCEDYANIESMPDQMYVDEYKISGLCAKCQDEFFN